MGEEPASARYLRYRGLRGQILSAAAKRVPLASIAQQARALSLWDGKAVAPGEEAQLAAAFDLGVLDPLGGHGRGIDREAKAAPPAEGSDAARMLAALQDARFGIFRLIGPEAAGGAAVESLPDGARLTIWDSYLAERTPPGRVFGARLAWPDPDLAMTCGVLAPLDGWALRQLLAGAVPERGPVQPRQIRVEDLAEIDTILAEPQAREVLAALLGKPGFAARLYRAAIDRGLMGPVPGRMPRVLH
ncbi:hypothetical protein [Siccirubricoccus phaeus]|uniref:hypothetical protein n=1 Tax=Siccirubricoccus phaeus TaxID=2595053 RepID=UPI0011F1EB2B|nr:hypothetical protein [Siccirubricoccus phaeus]